MNWAVGSTDSDSTVPIGTFNQPVGGASIGSIARGDLAIRTASITSALPTGLTLGAGRFLDSGHNFAVLLRALRGDGNTNILQTPSIITLDNEEAEIKVAQEVPFVTGQFTNTGVGNQQGQVNPFQTIQREEVGTILKITPQINEGDAVMLKIEQESSASRQGTQGAVDLITNKRTVTTKVLVDDGGVIVLGGLITRLGARKREPRAHPGLDPDHRRAVQDAQRREGKAQPDGVHPPDDPARRRCRGDRDEREVQRHAQSAAAARKGQRHAAAGRASAVAAADRGAVEVRGSDRWRGAARARH